MKRFLKAIQCSAQIKFCSKLFCFVLNYSDLACLAWLYWPGFLVISFSTLVRLLQTLWLIIRKWWMCVLTRRKNSCFLCSNDDSFSYGRWPIIWIHKTNWQMRWMHIICSTSFGYIQRSVSRLPQGWDRKLCQKCNKVYWKRTATGWLMVPRTFFY